MAQLQKSDSATVGEAMELKQTSHTAGGSISGIMSLALTSQVYFVPFLQPRNRSPRHLPQESIRACVAEVTHKIIYSNTFHNNLKLEITEIST